jgi:glycosyltransferase involved in cell wall biosynthesis
MELVGGRHLRVLLVANYDLDGQESMERFCSILAKSLARHQVDFRVIRPAARLGKLVEASNPLRKWLAYLDKYVIFPPVLRKAVAANDLIHICDHSNAVYVPNLKTVPYVVTCHDLLAVRAGLGEETYCPLSPLGKILQRWILSGLRSADMVVCDSRATRIDAERLLRGSGAKVELVPLGLNYPYVSIDRKEALRRLAPVSNALRADEPYLLHVGSSQPRKNRDGVLRIFARIKDRFAGQLVFVGEPLPLDLRHLADVLQVRDRVVEIGKCEDSILEALYRCAHALVYPSKSEGFGWPIIEAQACGCPVLTSDCGPCPDIVGDASLVHQVDDEAAFADSIMVLTDPDRRSAIIANGFANLKNFDTNTMIAEYLRIYSEISEASVGTNA